MSLLIFVLAGCGDESPKTSAPSSTASSATKPAPATRSSVWRPLANDALHDPANPALALLQEPADALSHLPAAQEGNFVDWNAAVRTGVIAPRSSLHPGTKVNLLDLDIILPDTAGQPMVRFPHREHSEWLDCSNCHDRIFVAKRGANDISMLAILEGRFCGQCHGAVSFPLTQCQRCHSVARPQVQRGRR